MNFGRPATGPLSAAELREMAMLERMLAKGLPRRIALGLAIGVLGGLGFAWFMVRSGGDGASFAVSERYPEIAPLERALGPLATFGIVCAAAFAVVGVILTWRVWRTSTARLAALQARAARASGAA